MMIWNKFENSLSILKECASRLWNKSKPILIDTFLRIKTVSSEHWEKNSSREVCAFLIGLIAGTLVALVAFFIAYPSSSNEPIDGLMRRVQTIGSGFIALSALVATVAYMRNNQRHKEEDDFKKSEQVLEHYQLTLQRAFESFIKPDSTPPEPHQSRLIWLTVARMLIRAEKILAGISEQSHIDLANEHREYWRVRFFYCLNDNRENMTKEFFRVNDTAPADGASRISIDSILIIFEFIRWKEEDVMDGVDIEKLIIANAGTIHFEYRGLEEFIEEFHPSVYRKLETALERYII